MAYQPGDLSLLLNPTLGVPKDVTADGLAEPVEAPAKKDTKKKKKKTTQKKGETAVTESKAEEKTATKKGKQSQKKGKTAAVVDAKEEEKPEPTTEQTSEPAGKKSKKKNNKKRKAVAAEKRKAAQGDAKKIKTKGPTKADLNEEKLQRAKERQKKFLAGKDNHADDPRLNRTLFVGNVPVDTKPKEITRVFTEFGEVESVRMRSFGASDPKLPKRAAFATKSFHTERDTCNAYVVFEELDAANKALSYNGKQINGRTVRVDLAGNGTSHDNTRSVFVGNLSFTVKDEEVRALFADCNVESVRLVRDKASGIGKGFGFVLLKDSSSVRKALTFDKSMFGDRPLRVFKSVDKPKKTNVVRKTEAKQATGAQRRTSEKKGKKKGAGAAWQGENASTGSKSAASKKKKHAERGKLFQKPETTGSGSTKKRERPPQHQTKPSKKKKSKK